MNVSKSSLHFALVIALAGCMDTSESTTPAPLESPEITQTQTKAVVDQGLPNWMVAGDEGLLELVGGTDGEPDVLTGRYALNGNPISAAAAGADRWIVVGNGKLQAIDSDALYIREVRDALAGQPVNTINPGQTGWLIGGGNGQIQLLDNEGEPTETTNQILQNANVTAAAWNGNSWLIGSADGRVTQAAANLVSANPDGLPVLNGSPVVGLVTGAAPVQGQSTDWYAFSFNSYERITGGGTPQGANLIALSLQITVARFVLDKILLGTADGRVGQFNPANGTVAWTNVLTNQAVTAIETDGTDLLILGANGDGRLLDTNLAPKADATSLATARRPVAGWFTNGRWLVAIGETAFIEFVGADLSPLRELTPVLNGAQIRAADTAQTGILLAGAQGKVQLVDTDGQPASAVATVGDGNTNLNAVAWNGDAFVVVGDGGLAQIVSNEGVPQGTPFTLLDGADLRFAAWSGEYWLIGGSDGKFARLRADGALSGSVNTLSGVTDLHAARFNGRAWMVAGTDGTNGVYALIQPDGTPGTVRTVNNFTGTFSAVEFNGLEWMLGGTDGFIQRTSAEGQLVGTPVNVLNGYDVLDIYFNGVTYVVSGQFGAIRRISADGQALRAPIAVINQRDAHTLVWTRPRGFAGGVCISNEACYEGPCVGGLLEGSCCDSACDRPCESCFQRDTGEADGTCAPVVAGKQPAKAGGCPRASESTCGLTGACDGAGECQYYGAEVSCGEPTCVAGRFTDAASCSGDGMCAIPAELDCRPYAGCTPEGGCATGCGSNSDCISGYECVDSQCVMPDDTTPEPGPGSESSDDGGCTTTGQNAAGPHWLIAFALLLSTLIVRRGAK